MTENEILERLKVANSMLNRYIEIVIPVASALAELKSRAVFGSKETKKYKGELGCWDKGLEHVCLHLCDYDNINLMKTEELVDKVTGFEKEWIDKFKEAGIHTLKLTGHY